jgi:secretion/DNA translocation related CpaE-like protein
MSIAAAPVRPLVVTADPDLLDDVLRLSAAAGVDVDVVPDPLSASMPWSLAPLVLVGDDASTALSRRVMPRRPGVVLVSRDLDDASIWKRAMRLGADHVALLPDADTWLIGRLGEAVDGGRPPGLTVAVVGGRGGAGASTLAAALAVTAVRLGRRTILVDADPLGGGADLLFAGEHAAGLRWPDIASASGRIRGEELRDALPCVGDLAVLSWDRGDPLELRAEAMSSVLAAACRACQVVVVDLPRHFDEVVHTALAAADVVLLVVPAEIRDVAAAGRVATQVSAIARDVRLVVRGPAPGGLAAGDVAAALGVPLAASLKAEPDLAAALERGEAPAGRGHGPLAQFCLQFLTSLPSALESTLGVANGQAATP